jgi:hypothetical protein
MPNFAALLLAWQPPHVLVVDLVGVGADLARLFIEGFGLVRLADLPGVAPC